MINNDVISIRDLSKDDINKILSHAEHMDEMVQKNERSDKLKGKISKDEG